MLKNINKLLALRPLFSLSSSIPSVVAPSSSFSTSRPSPPSAPTVPTIQSIQQTWDTFSSEYNNFDYCPQTLYYSLLYMLQTYKATNILEVACGTGKLLPIAVNMKRKDACYHATDLSNKMIELAKKNLRENYERYQSSVSFEDWMANNNISVFQCNAEEPLTKGGANNQLKNHQFQKYDRIICNCVLMITANAERMLKNLHNHAEKGCLLGVSVWGNKDNNNLMTSIRQSYLEANVPLPDQRSNFHLFKKVSKLAQSCGWETVLNWEQNALFPALEADSEKYKSFFFHQVNKIEHEGKRQEVKKILMGKIQRYLKEKRGLNFSCDMYVLRKK